MAEQLSLFVNARAAFDMKSLQDAREEFHWVRTNPAWAKFPWRQHIRELHELGEITDDQLEAWRDG